LQHADLGVSTHVHAGGTPRRPPLMGHPAQTCTWLRSKLLLMTQTLAMLESALQCLTRHARGKVREVMQRATLERVLKSMHRVMLESVLEGMRRAMVESVLEGMRRAMVESVFKGIQKAMLEQAKSSARG